MITFFTVFGGLGLFIYGMNLMANGLQKSASDKLRAVIEKLTTNKLMGLFLGTVVTMVIQSSSATTVMIIGFINAGIMNLNQAVGVIMGANIGTTVTGQLIALNLSEYAPLAIGIGVAMNMLSKKDKLLNVSEIIIGFGLLFLGLETMSNGLKPLAETETFQNLLIKFQNPFLAMIAGFFLTTLVQSSSASIGVLQALAAKDLIPINIALPILFGDNIGTTTTSLISSIGANVTAKRAALLHFLFNLIGTVLFMTLFRKTILNIVVHLTPDNTIRQIANAHSLFNILNVCIQLPFSNLLVKITEKLIPGELEESKKVAKYLDKRFLETPAIALEQLKSEAVNMGNITLQNLLDLKSLICYGDDNMLNKIFDTENIIDRLNTEISNFGILLYDENLSFTEKAEINIILDTVNHIERIGDHIENIAEYTEQNGYYQQYNFSKQGEEDTVSVFDDTINILKTALKAFRDDDYNAAIETTALEEHIDNVEIEYRENHLRRLNEGTCSIDTGIVFLGTMNNLERIADHCYNIAKHIEHKFNPKLKTVLAKD